MKTISAQHLRAIGVRLFTGCGAPQKELKRAGSAVSVTGSSRIVTSALREV